uniref:Bromodomain-containing protein 4 n=1 Tax=Anthurium amnicola TaxID=1678845 RepID=A0A1D1ZHW4_9ARAE
MSEASREMISHTKQNDRGPDYLGYYKHAALDLFLNEDIRLAFSGLDLEPSAGTYSGAEVGTCSPSDLSSSDQIVEGLSDFKQERLKILLHRSAVALNQEIDEIHDRISMMFQIEELREKELDSSCEGLVDPECRRQRSSLSDKFSNLADMCQSQSCKKLGIMEQNLEEYLNFLASKCRPMTPADKQLLGQQIHKLPVKALDRIVEIIHCSKSSEKQLPDKIHVDLEEEDNSTLWRLYFYVRMVERANKT